MRITKAESIAILIAGMLLSLAVGFFLGRNTVRDAVVIEAAAPETTVSQPSLSPKPSEASETPAASFPEAASLTEIISAPESGLLDLNTATVLELQTLPDIGPVLAQRIVDYRETYGNFLSVDELKNVDGIGDKILSSVIKYVEVVN